MTSKGLLFKILTYVVLIMLLFTMLGTLLGISNYNMSLSRLLDGFANSPTNSMLNSFGEKLNEFKNITDNLKIDKSSDVAVVNTLIGFVNGLSSGFFGMINLTITIFQMLGSVFTFAYYCWSTFLV